MTKMTKNGQSILDFIRSRPDHSAQPPVMIDFKCHPLAVIIGLTELGSTTEYTSYREVFGCDDFSKFDLTNDPDLCHLIDEAHDIQNFYRHSLTFKCLAGGELTSYELALRDAITQMDDNQLRSDLLPVAVKLRQFYQEDQQFENILLKHQSAPRLKNDCVHDFTARLKLVHTYTKSQRRHTDYVFYLFADENQYLYEAKMPKDTTVQSIVEQFFAQNQWVYLHTPFMQSVTDYRTNQNYFRMDTITIDQSCQTTDLSVT